MMLKYVPRQHTRAVGFALPLSHAYQGSPLGLVATGPSPAVAALRRTHFSPVTAAGGVETGEHTGEVQAGRCGGLAALFSFWELGVCLGEGETDGDHDEI